MIHASDLIGSIVCTESGTKLGRVHDLRVHFKGGAWLLMGVVVGSGGMKARFTGGDEDSLSAGDVVAWEAIARVDDGLVTVRDEIAPSIA
jgi:sporulation protein YlmC with PRC-barrel domain